MRPLLLAIVVLPALAGCAELRTTYTPSTGEPMHVYDKTVLKTGTQRVATGQDEVRDQQGNLVATNTHYENQQVSWTEREWYPMQGNARIDDESFYRITGDKDAAQHYDDWHHAGVGRNTVGWIVGAVGLGVLAGGVIAFAADTPGNKTVVDNSTTPPTTTVTPGERGAASTVGYIGMVAGGITAVVGLLLVLSGKHAAHAEDVRLYDEPERVKGDAAKYNDNLGSSPTTAANTSTPSPLAAAPGPAIHIGAFTASLAKDKNKKIELKGDGSILADGKKVAMISGSDVKDTTGSILFTVLADGSLKGDDLPNSKMRVDSDGLTIGESKVTVADDGTIVKVKKSGVETVGKIDKGSKDKRTAVLVLAAVATANRQ